MGNFRRRLLINAEKDKYWPKGTPTAIKESAVLWYDIEKQGATNKSLAANPILKDLSGNGHDMELRNFAYGGMSGVNGYNWNLDTFIAKNFEHTSSAVFLINSEQTIFEDAIASNFPATLKGQKIKVTSDGSGYSFQLYIQISSNTSILYREFYTITSDGTYEVKDVDLTQYTDIANLYYGFRAIKVPEGVTVKVELAPNYPGALVSDGVDDYGYVEGLPLLTKEKGFTIVSKRVILGNPENNAYGSLASDNLNSTDGAFVYEGLWKVTNAIQSFGGVNYNLPFPPLYSFMTSKLYNSYSLRVGGNLSSNAAIRMFAISIDGALYFNAFALYSFILFDRDLTDEEIEWVKTNLIE